MLFNSFGKFLETLGNLYENVSFIGKRTMKILNVMVRLGAACS